jgi:hypothetical protein
MPASWFKVDRVSDMMGAMINGFGRGIRSTYWSGLTDLLKFSDVKDAMPWAYDWGSSDRSWGPFRWNETNGSGSPGAYSIVSKAGENWSSSHVAQFLVKEEGYYRFQVAGDDGHRLIVDRVTLWDRMTDDAHLAETSADGLFFGKGFHSIRLDHMEKTGDASLYMWVQRRNADGTWPGYRDFQDGEVYVNFMGETWVSPGGFATMAATASATVEPVLVSPTGNTVLTTNKPTFSWQIGDLAFTGLDIVLRAEPAASSDTGPFVQTGSDGVVSLLPAEIRVVGSTADYQLEADDALPAGHWRWEVVEISSGNTRTTSTTSGMFELDPGLEVDNVINYPNPFAAQTKIRYKLSKDADFVTIKIYTVAGNLVRELDGTTFGTSTNREYNDVVWDGTNDYGQPVNNGPYLYTVTVVSDRETRVIRKKMFRLR